ncbi:unnamed protein product [Boreogadus saida]
MVLDRQPCRAQQALVQPEEMLHVDKRGLKALTHLHYTSRMKTFTVAQTASRGGDDTAQPPPPPRLPPCPCCCCGCSSSTNIITNQRPEKVLT